MSVNPEDHHSTFGSENYGSESSPVRSPLLFPHTASSSLSHASFRFAQESRLCKSLHSGDAPNVEECRSLSLPKSSSMNIQTGIRGFVSAMI